MAKVLPRSATPRQPASLDDRAEIAKEVSKPEAKEESPDKAPKSAPTSKKAANKTKEVTVAITGRITGVKRTNAHIYIPAKLTELIKTNVKGSEVSIYTTLLHYGYEALMKEAKSGNTHIDIEEIIEKLNAE